MATATGSGSTFRASIGLPPFRLGLDGFAMNAPVIALNATPPHAGQCP